MRQISIGYLLITGDLPAYDLQCLFSLITYRGTCVLALRQWPNALHILNCSRFECRCSELIKCAAHLTKCMYRSIAPYRNTTKRLHTVTTRNHLPGLVGRVVRSTVLKDDLLLTLQLFTK